MITGSLTGVSRFIGTHNACGTWYATGGGRWGWGVGGCHKTERWRRNWAGMKHFLQWNCLQLRVYDVFVMSFWHQRSRVKSVQCMFAVNKYRSFTHHNHQYCIWSPVGSVHISVFLLTEIHIACDSWSIRCQMTSAAFPKSIASLSWP